MKKKILIQFDTDAQASTFDAIVALDSGVDQLLTRSSVVPEQVMGLVHGAMFTRGPSDLKSTALFFGGSDVTKTEALVDAARASFFETVRVSLMSDPNGSNTTAAAAVLCAQKHLDLNGKRIVILGGTGPVGQRIAKIIAGVAGIESSTLVLCSRRQEKADAVCDAIQASIESSPSIQWQPSEAGSSTDAESLAADADVVFAAGAAGVTLLGTDWQQRDRKVVLIDVNAVPPEGIAGLSVMDAGKERGSAICYGALGVGGLKMKIHKRAIGELFGSNDLVLDTDAIYQLGASL